jgi:hypothetical protein
MFWSLLSVFWPEEKINAWKAQLFPVGISEPGVDKVYNRISLSSDAHYIWGIGAFALKPISLSDDRMTLVVQFFWQKSQQQDTQQTISLTTTPFSTENKETYEGLYGTHRLLNERDRRIKSGDYFTLHTDDPENRPLPSLLLLELQWFLQRVVGLAGAPNTDWPSLSELGQDESDTEYMDADEEDMEEQIFVR